ncbi:Endonuclease/exonuclease/phosphatase [Morchella snyderi]|nr:Endonuclease/exonuclease/phosphatase [Morchella snyderi]
MRFLLLAPSLFPSLVSAVTISAINGPAFRSPYENQSVTNVTGLVTAVAPSGFFLRDTTPDRDVRTSGSIYVFTTSATIRESVAAGDIVTIDGKVSEYRSSKDYLYLSEITSPTNMRKISSGNAVKPVVLGVDRSPPAYRYSALDDNDVFGVPNNRSLVSVVNATLHQDKYGLDFWESLSGELVSVKAPVALSMPNNYGDVWVRGNYRVTGKNSRGGLSIVPGVGADANPEAILIGDPLDGTDNAVTKLGDDLGDITGVITCAFGFYRILPLTALSVKSNALPLLPPPTALTSAGACSGLTFGSYNVENLTPNSTHLPLVAEHISVYLNTPDFVFLQEIQDNDGATNSAVVSANITLQTLADAIEAISGVEYSYLTIDPIDDKDGGQPGGNIRVAYFYRPDLFSLRNPNPGSGSDKIEVLPGGELNFNPGRIDPENEAWTNSRKPLVAAFDTVGGDTVYAINVHFGSKGGSSSLYGDARPPVNGGVDDRQKQAELVAGFIQELQAENENALVIAAGDFNEFSYVSPMKAFKDIAWDLDEVVGIPVEERYTYLYDMNCQQLDHMLVSRPLKKDAKYEHVSFPCAAGSQGDGWCEMGY